MHEVKLLLKDFVRNMFITKNVKPTSWNNAYYPSDKDITNHIYIAIQKLKLDKLDQTNLEKKINNWKNEDNNRKFYLRRVDESIGNYDVNKKGTFLMVLKFFFFKYALPY